MTPAQIAEVQRMAREWRPKGAPLGSRLLRPHWYSGASGPKTSGLIFIAMLIGGRRSTRGGRVSARRNIEALSSGVIRQ
jgi:hypothetical protein